MDCFVVLIYINQVQFYFKTYLDVHVLDAKKWNKH